MRARSTGVLGALALGLIGCPASAPAPDPTPEEPPTFSAETSEALRVALGRARVNPVGNAVAPPGATAAVIAPDGRIWTGAAGFSDDGAALEMDPADLLRIGSITKTWVAAATLRVIGDDALSLDDTVDGWFPDIPHADVMTVRDLLAHTSGIPSYTDITEFLEGGFTDPVEHEQIVDWSVAHGPDFAPGDAFAYSNTNYYVLGLILEDVTGREAHEALWDLYATAGQRGTFMEGEEEGTFAPVRGYLDGLDVTTRVDPSWTWTSGGLVAPAEDVARWMAALVDGRVLGEELTALQQTETQAPTGPAGYGLGMYVVDRGWGLMRGHTGSTMGFQSDCFVHAGSGVVVATQANDFLSEASDLSDALWAALEEVGEL